MSLLVLPFFPRCEAPFCTDRAVWQLLVVDDGWGEGQDVFGRRYCAGDRLNVCELHRGCVDARPW